MEKTLSVLVIGATGHQGGAVSYELLYRGHKVRCLTRKPESPSARRLKVSGAEIYSGNMEDRDALRRALRAVDAVFAMSTPFEEGVETEIRQGKLIAEEAKKAEVKHFVFSSVAGCDRNTGIPHFESKRHIEDHIKSLGLPYTIVRPVFFMENFMTPGWILGFQQGKLAMALPPTRKLQQIGLTNIGEFVVLSMEKRDLFLGKTMEIASDELTGTQCAEILSRASGQKILYSEIPLNQLASQNPDYGKMFDWFNRVGYNVDILNLKKSYPEITWNSFEEWTKEQDWSLLKQPVALAS